MYSFKQHTASPAGRIIDCFSFFWLQNLCHQSHNGSWGIEFPCFLVSSISELLYKVFISLSCDIRFNIRIRELMHGKVFYKVVEQFIRKTILICPLRISKYSIKSVRIGFLDASHGSSYCIADIYSVGTDIFPMAAFWYRELMILRV